MGPLAQRPSRLDHLGSRAAKKNACHVSRRHSPAARRRSHARRPPAAPPLAAFQVHGPGRDSRLFAADAVVVVSVRILYHLLAIPLSQPGLPRPSSRAVDAEPGHVVDHDREDEDEQVNRNERRVEPAARNQQVKPADAMRKSEEQYGDDLIKFNEDRYQYLTDNPISGGTSIDKLIEHIDYIVKLVGVDYVGLGSDFDGGVYTPNEIYDATCYPIITKKLVEKGYSEQDIRKILGLNFLRVFKQVCAH